MKESQVKDNPRIEVIDTFNEKPKSWGVRHDLAFACIGIFIATVTTFHVFLGVPLPIAGALGILFAASWVFVAYKSPHDFLSKFISLPGDAYYTEPVLFVPASDPGTFKRKIKSSSKPIVNKQKQKLYPFYGESDLHAIMEIDFGSTSFAVYLKYDKKTGWSATIPLALEGLHTEMLDEDAFTYGQELTRILKDIPVKEDFTVMLGCRSKHDRKDRQLEKLRNNNRLPLVDLILASDGFRSREITQKALRQQWSQYVYISWEQQNQYLRDKDDAVGAVVNFIGNFIESQSVKLTGITDDRDYNVYTQIARDIYDNSFCVWESILERKGRLQFKALSGEEAWEHLWYKYNNRIAPLCPQIIKVSKKTGEYKCSIENANKLNPKDIFSVLFENNNHVQHNHRRDSIECNGDLIATMVVVSPPEYWKDTREQMLWCWSNLAELGVHDTEIYTQFTKRNKAQADRDLKTITKQNTFRKKDAILKGEGVDVDATFKYDKAVEGQVRLYAGGSTLYAAVVILIYRKTHEDLKRACRQIEDIFSPARLKREQEVSLSIWLEAQIFNNKKLLTSNNTFTERRYILDSLSARGVVPIAKPRSLHERGVELVTEEGGFPIHINLLQRNERMIILGETGSGKSVLGAGFITHALAEGAKTIVVDMSKSGESTFKVYVQQLREEGSYINLVADKYFNILQPPDLSSVDIPKAKKRERYALWKEFLQTIIIAIVMGQNSNINSERFQRVSSIVVTLLKVFFDDPNILQRYSRAFEQGWKSEAWQAMPVLKDLMFYCSLAKLNLEYTDEFDEAVKFIKNQIESKLSDPNIGKAIGSVSNVPPTPSLVMFALSGLNNENNSYIMSLVAQMACLNISLESKTSLAVFDEISELLKKSGFVRVLASTFTRGRKEGMSAILIGQDLGTIVKSEVKDQIVKNTNYWAIGNIRGTGSPEDYVNELNLPLDAISQNRSRSFGLDSKIMRSRFLVKKSKECHWHCYYYPSAMSLSVTANSRLEMEARARILSQFPETEEGVNKGLALFAKELYRAYSSGKPIEKIGYESKTKATSNGRDRYYVGSSRY